MMARRGAIVVLALCTLAAAMVPRHTRSLPEEESAPAPASNNHGGSSSTGTCDHETPCLWTVYTRFTRKPDYNITNHCVCGPETTCKYFDDDISISAYVYRCLPLS